MTEATEAGARQALLQGFGILSSYGLGARIAGHLTRRHPDRDAFWTHRFGLGFEEVGASDLVLADFDLNVLEGDAAINPTMHIHAALYRARPDVSAISHTHGPQVVALSATDAEFVACSQMAGLLHGHTTVFDEQELIVLNASEGDAMAAALGQGSALILRNHGCLVAGASVAEAVLLTITLEEAAEAQLRAMATGRMRGMDAAAADQVRRFVLQPAIVGRYWDYEVRRMARRSDIAAPPRAGGSVP